MDSKPKSTRTIEIIREVVSEVCLVRPEELFEKSGKRKSVEARQIMMYMMRKFMHLTYQEILVHFKARNHTTVMYSLQTIGWAMEHDRRVIRLTSAIMAEISKRIEDKDSKKTLSHYTIFDGKSAHGMYKTEHAALLNVEKGERVISVFV